MTKTASDAIRTPWIDRLGASLKSVVKMMLHPRGTSYRPAPQCGPLVILGNGPSLRHTIDAHADYLRTVDTMAVNFAANTPEFRALRPRYYVLADPHFFDSASDPNVAKLIANLASVDWPMTLLLPRSARHRCTIRPTEHLNIEWYPLNAVEGFRRLTDSAISRRHAMPRPRNVLIPALVNAIWLGYRQIYITGADHSWIHNLTVDDDNSVVSLQPHYYTEDDHEVERVRRDYMHVPLHQVLASLATALRSYFVIADYAERHGIDIYNATPGSFIDAFERRQLPDGDPADVMRIDIDSVLRQRLGSKYRYIPKRLVRWLERTICQRDLNRLLYHNRHARNAEFCTGVLRDLDVKVRYHGTKHLPDPTHRRVLFVCNHPLGGLDGLALIDFITNHYGAPVYFVVNDLLSAIKPLEGVFLPVNKHGAQGRDAVKAIDDAFAGDNPIIMFPAGLVSRRGRGGVVADLEWQKMFVNKARQTCRDIIPLYFDGENSQFFYKFAKFRKRLGLRFNIEMIYLPREVFRSAGKHFNVYVGQPISCDDLPANSEAAQYAEQIRRRVYALKPDRAEAHPC